MNLSLPKDLYNRMPVALQNLAINYYGWWWKKRRFGGVFHKQLEAFKKRENFTSDQWDVYQLRQLKALLIHSFDQVPFYHQKWSREGWKRSHFEKLNWKDFYDLPFLTKQDLRKHGKLYLLAGNRRRDGVFIKSSGSTGTPVELYFSRHFQQRWTAAMEARVRNWAGVSWNTPRGMIGGRQIVGTESAGPPFYRYNSSEKQTYFSAYHISLKNAPNYLKGIKQNNVQYMTGYAFSNYLLAKCFEELGLHPPAMKAVICSSEKLTREMKELMERVYQCRVFDSYSGAEACGLVSESPEGQLLFSPDTGILEVLNDQNERVENGRQGEVVLTGLLNFDQPLIRYKIGDFLIKSSSQQCSGNRSMPVIEEISGRVEDAVRCRDGRIMVRFHSVFYEVPGLQKAQLVQKDYDHFEVRIESDSNYEAGIAEELIRKRLEDQISKGIEVKFSYTDSIPLGPNGKFKAVISELNQSMADI